MAKMKLSESGFELIPEGTTIFKVFEVDDSKYDEFGKIAVNLATAKGQKHTENFTLVKANGEVNEKALKAWSYFARVCLNNFQADEIDSQDIVGCYIQATVKHEEYTRTKGNHAGEIGTAEHLNDYAVASGFAKSEETTVEDDTTVDDDIDDFLGDE